MKLYYAPNTCSLAPHVVAREAGIALDLVRVDIAASPHRTQNGTDFTLINPKGYVPALELDGGELLTEGVAIVQFLADLVPDRGLAPPAGTLDRYRLQEWLTFVSSELHKMFSPWLFHPEHGELAQEAARDKIRGRLALLDRHLSGSPFLMGERFTVADAYCFTIVGWSPFTGIDLAPYPHLKAFMDRIAARPAVRDALHAERRPAAADATA
ncbi:glutathione transferase GstA [Arenibaculum sp.]|uniref:glutathione transferase GstA n=1 Tax=Arenibaculum sp. TaxID=2865862 RepID=UPI002E0D83A5|nr:glutathione transferase GstA [Arenibaculum sp.]